MLSHRDSLLRFAIRLDGVIIAISGIVILAAVEPLSRALAAPVATLQVIGAANLAYLPIAVALAALRRVAIGGVLAVAANLASAGALLADLIPGSARRGVLGVALEIAATAYCLAIGGFQVAGLAQASRA